MDVLACQKLTEEEEKIDAAVGEWNVKAVTIGAKATVSFKGIPPVIGLQIFVGGSRVSRRYGEG